MFNKVLIISFLFGVLFAQSPDELYKIAQASLDAGKVSKAEEEFKAALQADPTFAPAYLGLAHVSMRKGDLKKAGESLKEAIEADPENKAFREEFETMNELNTLMSKGIRSMKNGDADNAFESFRVAFEKFPNYPESVFNMGLTHFRKKEFTEAVDYFGKTLEINPEHKTAQASLDAGKVSKAEEEFNAALQADPTFAPAYLGLAHVSMRKGDLKKAGESLKEAIEADPENKAFREEFETMSELNTLMSKGIRSMKNGDADNAFESFRVAFEKFPNYPESVFNMGLTHFRKKEFTEAVDYFSKTLEINPEHKTAYAAIKNVAKNYFNKGNQSYKRGDLEGALSSCLLYTSPSPRDRG